MNEHSSKFWNRVGEYYPEIIKTISELSPRSYISLTDMETMETWWSQRALDFFGVEENLTKVGHEKVKITIHPDDKEPYREAWRNRMNGVDLDKTIEYRVESRKGHYDRFSAKANIITDEVGNKKYLLSYYRNHGIAEEVDSVTGLHSEKTLSEKMREYIATGTRAVIVKIGLNQFSRMNVLYGGDYADDILSAVSEQLIANKTDKGFAYRMQGAKFAICYDDISRDELQNIYNNIVYALANKVEIDGKKVPLKISGGAVRLEPNMTDTNGIRSRMTYALEHSRYSHHGELVMFNDEVCGNNADKLDLVSIIHQSAVDDFDGFFLCYQPIVDTNTDRIKGMEALIRWKREPYGQVPPNVFIDWLEDDACIFDLGNWILETALEDCKKIAAMDSEFFVNVNVCAAQLEHPEFRNRVLSAVKKANVKPSLLCLELTERCRNLDVVFLRQEIEFFRANGIKIALDDFGTGGSSLSVALDLPLDEVKIDMSFIRGIVDKPANQAMVKYVVDFSNNINVEICLEGVEDETTRDHLIQYGATWFQGYYYSKPVPVDEFEILMKNR